MPKRITVGKTKSITNFSCFSFEERKMQLQQQDKVEHEKIIRERKSPFSRWTQYNNDYTKEMMWLASNHPKAHAILYFLIDQMDNNNAVMCSYRVLQEIMGVGQATIARSIKVLKDNGYMAVLKSGNSNVYTINDNVFWKSWGNKKQYSKFPANIILALSEQEDYVQLSLDFDNISTEKHKEIIIKPPKNKDEN